MLTSVSILHIITVLKYDDDFCKHVTVKIPSADFCQHIALKVPSADFCQHITIKCLMLTFVSTLH